MGIFLDWIQKRLSEAEKRPDYSFDRFVKSAEELERDVRTMEDDAEKKEKELDDRKTDLERNSEKKDDSKDRPDDSEGSEETWTKIRKIALDRKKDGSKEDSDSDSGESTDSSD